MLSEPAAWQRLMTRLVTVQADYLAAQVRAGASALQVFDSWAGRALGQSDYVRYVQPHNKRLFEAVSRTGVPVINFSLGVCSYVEEAVACGGDVIGLDWHLPLRTSWSRIGYDRPVQGNLDPTALLAPWPELKLRVDQVLDDAAGRPGHIFNVGHGVLQSTPVESVRRLVEYVGERSSRSCGMTVASISTRAGVLPIGVLIMAYGGPSSLAEMPGYLADIRSGRPTSREVLEEISAQLRGDRRPLAAARDLPPPGRRRAGSARPCRLPLLSRHAALGAVDRGGRRRDARGRHHARGQRGARAALQRALRSRNTPTRSPRDWICTAARSRSSTSRATTIGPS